MPVGLVAGYYHGWLSDLLMRVSDIFLAVPQVVLAIAIAQTLGPSLPNVILALSVTYWPWFARVVYAETRSLQKEVFVECTAALGASPWRLVVLHVLPNIASPIIVRASIGMGFTILTAAALGFLGLGPPPAHAGVGPDDRRIARVPARRLVVRGGAGPRHLPHRHGLQPARRRPARRARPAAAPQPRAGRAMAELLSVRELSVDFVTDQGVAQVLDRISLDIAPGEVVGLVGESGCGKTTLARAILGILPAGRRADPRRRDPLQGTTTSCARTPRRLNDEVRGRAITVHPAGSLHLVHPGVHRRARQIMDLMKWKSPRSRRARGPAGALCDATRATATARTATPCWRCCARCRSRSRRGRSAACPTSSPAASASGS